jgi:hypothetical protein
MDVNDNEPSLDDCVVQTFFASKLAPTGGKERGGCPCIEVQCKNRVRPQLLGRAAPALKKTPRPTPVTSERIALCEQV